MIENSSKIEEYPSCLRCGIQMKLIMKMPVRTGGTTGFFANWAEMSEKIITFDTFRCPRCRKIEFFDLDESLPKS